MRLPREVSGVSEQQDRHSTASVPPGFFMLWTDSITDTITVKAARGGKRGERAAGQAQDRQRAAVTARLPREVSRVSEHQDSTRRVPPGFLMMLTDSRLVLPLRRMTASTASAAKWSLSCVRILLLSVVRAMFSRSCAHRPLKFQGHSVFGLRGHPVSGHKCHLTAVIIHLAGPMHTRAQGARATHLPVLSNASASSVCWLRGSWVWSCLSRSKAQHALQGCSHHRHARTLLTPCKAQQALLELPRTHCMHLVRGQHCQ